MTTTDFFRHISQQLNFQSQAADNNMNIDVEDGHTDSQYTTTSRVLQDIKHRQDSRLAGNDHDVHTKHQLGLASWDLNRTPSEMADSADALLAAIYSSALPQMSSLIPTNLEIKNKTTGTVTDTVPFETVSINSELLADEEYAVKNPSDMSGIKFVEPRNVTAGSSQPFIQEPSFFTVEYPDPNKTAVIVPATSEPVARDKRQLLDYVNGLISSHSASANSGTHSNGSATGSSSDKQWNQPQSDLNSNFPKNNKEAAYNIFDSIHTSEYGNEMGVFGSTRPPRRTFMDHYQFVPLNDGIDDIITGEGGGGGYDDDSPVGDERYRDGRVSRIGSYGGTTSVALSAAEGSGDFNSVIRQVRSVIDADGGVDDETVRRKLKEV